MNLKKSWTDLKNLVDTRNLRLQHEEYTGLTKYYIFAQEGSMEYSCMLPDVSADTTDFENNYKSTSNKPIIGVKTITGIWDRTESRDSATVSNIDIADGMVNIVTTTTQTPVIRITDLVLSSNKPGTFRIRIDGVTLFHSYNRKNETNTITFGMPLVIPTTKTLKVLFETDTDNAKASVMVSGYLDD